MKHLLYSIARMRTSLTISALVALTLLNGCGISPPVVAVTPIHSRQKYLARFTQAFDMRNAAGDYEVVLLDDPIDHADDKDAGQPLQPNVAPPLRQVLHIRLLWKPVAGAKADSPAATNASLHWYVIGTTTVDGTPFIHYSGAAFVSINTNGPGVDVTIRNGLLKRVDLHGDLVDPLQTFRIDGKFDAAESDTRVTEIMNDVKSALGEAKTGPVSSDLGQ